MACSLAFSGGFLSVTGGIDGPQIVRVIRAAVGFRDKVIDFARRTKPVGLVALLALAEIAVPAKDGLP